MLRRLTDTIVCRVLLLFLSAVAGGFCYLSAMVSSFQGMEVGLRPMACYFAIQAIVSLVLLIVGLTGGIPPALAQTQKRPRQKRKRNVYDQR